MFKMKGSSMEKQSKQKSSSSDVDGRINPFYADMETNLEKGNKWAISH